MTTTVNASTSAGLIMTPDTSGILQLQTANTTAVTIDASQNVGLGVTPSAWYSSSKVLQINAGAVIEGISAANITYANAYRNASNVLTYIASDYASRYSQSSGVHSWSTAASGTAGNPITFNTAMTLDASGSLGVGTTSPASRLHVYTASGTADVRIQSNTYASSFSLYAGAGGANAFGIYDNNASAYRAIIDSSGNFGLGVAPSAWGSGQVVFQNKGGALSAGSSGELYLGQNIYYGGSPAADRYVGSLPASSFGQSAGVFTWRVAPSGTAGNPITFNTAMTLDNSGNLLVGTTSNGSSARLKAEGTSTTQIQSIHNNSTGQSIFSIGVAAASTSWYHFNGVSGNNTVQNILIYGNGNIQNANNSYGSLSDLKLKENITDATPKLAKLQEVRVVNYNLKGEYEKHKQIGVIAQELEHVFPSLVEETIDRDSEGNELGTTTKSVKYSVFVPILIKAIQEQQAIIQQLTARIETLEAK